MILADLIRGNKVSITLPPANANPANPAKVDPVLVVFEPRLAGLATLALAEREQADIFEPCFRDIGIPANDGKDLPHYCEPGDCWCSERLPISNYPSGCINCEHNMGA